MNRFFLLLVLLSSLSLHAQTKYTPKMYIDQFSAIAMEEMKVSKVPASITLAQGLLESGNGNSRLSRKGNNHFGIKCKRNWTGKTIRENDDAPDECFRAYNSAYDSYRDHSNFLRNNRRYNPLFELHIMDYKGWAKGLRKAGYATNPAYSKLLIRMIERYNLNHFDSIVFFNKSIISGVENITESQEMNLLLSGKMIDNGVPVTLASEGESLKSIAHNNDKMTWQIRRYNDLPKGTKINPGDIIYLKPKRRKASIPQHKVKLGQSMWDVSQVYGVKLKRLYRINKMKRGTNASPGATLNLRKKTKMRPDTSSIHIYNKEVVRKAKTLNGVDGAIKHLVQKGETLYWITRHYNTKALRIQKLNPSKIPLRTGDTLLIKESEKRVVPDMINKEPVKVVVKNIPYYPNNIKADTIKYIYSADSALKFYMVKSNQSIKTVSDLTGISIDTLVRLNGEVVLSGLRKGQLLLVKQLKPMVDERFDDGINADYYIVSKGETLYSISRKLKKSIDSLKVLNPELENNDISVGQKIKLK